MNHDKATEEFFRLRGWKYYEFDPIALKQNYWSEKEYFAEKFEDLPKICESMTDWIKYVAEFMEGEGYMMRVAVGCVCWDRGDQHFSVRIKDHQILYASVLAANEYLKGRQND